MPRMRILKSFALLSIVVLVSVGTGHAMDISGTISSTLTITENSKLVGDVTCTVIGAPCIAFGGSGLTLDLNGFTMTGLADPQTTCSGGPTTLASRLSESNPAGIAISRLWRMISKQTKGHAL